MKAAETKQMFETLGRIEEKCDHMASASEDHEKRLRLCERSNWANRGGMAVVAMLLAFFGYNLGR